MTMKKIEEGEVKEGKREDDGQENYPAAYNKP
jgi:hypothetical protein